jgi:thiol-disulfide isomerase/thioredoxin
VIALIAAGVCLATADAKEILAACSKAVGSLKSVKYTVEVEKGGQKSVGTVRQDFEAGRLFINGKRPDAKQFVLGFDGMAWRFGDPNSKLKVDVVPDARPEAKRLLLPLSAERISKVAPQLLGKTVVSASQCDIVGDDAEKWFIDRRTHLPMQIQTPSERITVLSISFEGLPAALPEMKGFDWMAIAKMDTSAWSLLPFDSEAPDFSAKDAKGRVISKTSLPGKLVLLDFWATWCGPCIASMPKLQTLHKEFGSRGLTVVSVTTRDPKGDPMGFMKRKNYEWTLIPKGDEVAKAFHVTAIPTLYLIGADGKILFRATGLTDDTEEVLGTVIDEALGRLANELRATSDERRTCEGLAPWFVVRSSSLVAQLPRLLDWFLFQIATRMRMNAASRTT